MFISSEKWREYMNQVSYVHLGFHPQKIDEGEKAQLNKNRAITALKVAGIGAAAITAGVVCHKAKTEGTLINKAVTTVVEKSKNLVPESVKSKFVAAKASVLESEIVKQGGKAKTEIVGLGKELWTSVKNNVMKLPKTVRVLSGIALGALAVSHVSNAGQIKGAHEGYRQVNDISNQIVTKLIEEEHKLMGTTQEN